MFFPLIFYSLEDSFAPLLTNLLVFLILIDIDWLGDYRLSSCFPKHHIFHQHYFSIAKSIRVICKNLCVFCRKFCIFLWLVEFIQYSSDSTIANSCYEIIPIRSDFQDVWATRRDAQLDNKKCYYVKLVYHRASFLSVRVSNKRLGDYYNHIYSA